jgi:dynein light intermediate chain 1, cytosolic
MTGGSVDSQREFLEALTNNGSSNGQGRNLERSTNLPPIANRFALGYTYYDVLDADQEGQSTTACCLHSRTDPI